MGKDLDAVVLGFGGMGGLITDRFLQNGRSVAAVGRKPWVEAIEKNGLRVRNLGEEKQEHIYYPDDSFKVFHEETAQDLANLSLKEDGLIVLASKTPQMKELLEQYLSLVYDGEKRHNILLIQNGIYPERDVEKMLQESKQYDPSIVNHVIGSLTMARIAVVDYDSPTIESQLAKISVGSWDGIEKKQGPFHKVISDLSYVDGSIVAEFTPEKYKLARFAKATLNGANVISAVFGVNVGEIVDNPYIGHLMQKKIEESVAVAKAEKIDLSAEFMYAEAARIYGGIVREHLASMGQDVKNAIEQPERTLVTEIDELDGSFAAIGKEHNINTPYNAFFHEYMNDFTSVFNQLNSQDPQKSAAFALEVQKKNQELVGIGSNQLPPVLGMSPEAIAYRLGENLKEVALKYETDVVPIETDFKPVETPTLYIMHIDDDPQANNFAEELQEIHIPDHPELSQYNIQIETFTDPEEALHAYESDPTKYVFTINDVHMSSMGFDVFAKQKAIHPIAGMYDTAFFEEGDYDRAVFKTQPVYTSNKNDRNYGKILEAIASGIQITEESRRLSKFKTRNL